MNDERKSMSHIVQYIYKTMFTFYLNKILSFIWFHVQWAENRWENVHFDIEANILANELCRSGFYKFSSVLAVANKLAQIHVLYNQYMVTTIEPFEFVSRVFVVS